MSYTVRLGLRGKKKVEFTCERCGFELASPLEQAGQLCSCPSCRHEQVVPGVAEWKQQQAEAASRATEQMQAAQKRAAEDQAVKDRQSREEAFRSRQDAEAAREKEFRRREREQSTAGRSVSPAMFTIGLLTTFLLSLGMAYFMMVWPLQRKLVETQNQLADLTGAVGSLSSTVNHNAGVAAAYTSSVSRGLDSLTKTVNHNADAANQNTDGVRASVRSLATALDSLTDTVNHNANVANMNARGY